MTNSRIKQVVDFLYSSNKASEVPLRITIELGQYAGASLTKDELSELLFILSNSIDLKKDLNGFITGKSF